jgi:signal transduction histidine kinase
MRAIDLLQYSTQAIFLLIFVVVTIEAVRRPRPVHWDVVWLFGIAALLIVLTPLQALLDLSRNRWATALDGALIMSLAYPFARLVDDFVGLPFAVKRFAEVGLVVSLVAVFVVPQPYPVWLVLPLVLYFVFLEVYGSVVVVRAAQRSSGVTLRRMQAVAAGSTCLGLVVVTDALQSLAPALTPWWLVLGAVLGIGAGLGYFLGFAPPTWLRHAWQAPALRDFILQATGLAARDSDQLALGLERETAAALGCEGAVLARWDSAAEVLRFRYRGEPMVLTLPDTIAGRVFTRQRAEYSENLERDNPAQAAWYRKAGTVAVLAAPMTVGDRRLGVLLAYAQRAPIFDGDDLSLLCLLADQAAVILENRRLLDEMTQARAREEERQRLYGLLMQAPALICYLRGPTHLLEFANDQFVAWEGARTALGRPIQEVASFLGSEDFVAHLDRVYATGEAFRGVELFVPAPARTLVGAGGTPGADHGSPAPLDRSPGLPDRRPDLPGRYLNLAADPSRDAGGRVDGVLVHAVDVTEQVRARQELQELNAELERRVAQRTAELSSAVQELEAFSYSVSHDLRAPLRTIDGFSQALLEDFGDRLDAASQEDLQRIRGASQRMGQLIDDLLRLSRVTRGDMLIGLVDLSAIAREVAAELQRSKPDRPVTWVIADDLIADGDARLLRVVLENLLGNCWKFTMPKDQPRIEFGRTLVEGVPTYFVCDNGVGFDMAYANKLFGAFQRLHSVTEFEGTGIGLATVRRIIRRHGGQVWGEGMVDAGATFYFTLGQTRSGEAGQGE